MGGITFKAIDLGGHKEARKLWRDYYSSTDAIVYLIDTADRERLAESCIELNKVLTAELPDMQQTPLLVLGNKIDMDGAISEQELRECFHLMETTGKGKIALPEHIRPVEVFMCSIVNREGYREGIQWLAQYIN